MNAEIKVVFFDLWLTLIYGLSEDPILTLQRLLEDDKEAALDPNFLTTCLTTDIKRPGRFLTHVGAKHGYSISALQRQQFRDLVRRERQAATLYPESLEVLETLKQSGYRLGLISNLWPFPVERVFNRMGLAQHFEHCLYSFEVGSRKPDLDIFAAACRKFAVEPGHCLMVGDSLVSDIGGALAAGMQATFVSRSVSPTAVAPSGVRTIQSLRQLI
jgi:HAD superfamily hydrolase (TIGR01509 family)